MSSRPSAHERHVLGTARDYFAWLLESSDRPGSDEALENLAVVLDELGPEDALATFVALGSRLASEVAETGHAPETGTHAVGDHVRILTSDLDTIDLPAASEVDGAAWTPSEGDVGRTVDALSAAIADTAEHGFDAALAAATVISATEPAPLFAVLVAHQVIVRMLVSAADAGCDPADALRRAVP